MATVRRRHGLLSGGGGGGGIGNPLTADLDAAAFAILSNTGDLNLGDSVLTQGANVVAHHNESGGRFIVREAGGTPGLHEIQFWNDQGSSNIASVANTLKIDAPTSLNLARGGATAIEVTNVVSFLKTHRPKVDSAVESGSIGLRWINTHTVNLLCGGDATFSGIPTSDPASTGKIWNDSGTLKISL